jgi:serine/threonine protein kinase
MQIGTSVLPDRLSSSCTCSMRTNSSLTSPRSLSENCRFPQWTVNRLPMQLANAGVDPIAIDLLSRLFVINPAARLTAQQCLDHPFFDEFRSAFSRTPNLSAPLFSFDCGVIVDFLLWVYFSHHFPMHEAIESSIFLFFACCLSCFSSFFLLQSCIPLSL